MADFKEGLKLVYKVEYNNDPKKALHQVKGETFITYKGINRKAWPKWEGWVIIDPRGVTAAVGKTPQRAYNSLNTGSNLLGASSGVPDAPYKKSWYKIAIRDNMREVVEKGLNGLTINTAAILETRYPRVKADFKTLYDKQIPKFIESEYGIKPEKVWTETNSGPVEVWYVPAT